MSQTFKLVSTKPSSADPQKEPISVETAEDGSPSISPPDAAKVFFKILDFHSAFTHL